MRAARPPRRRLPRSPAPPASVVAELLELAFLQTEVMAEFVEHGDPDLSLELVRIRKRLLERAAVDRDRRRQVRILAEEAQEIGLVRVLLLDDDGHVLQPPRDAGRQRVERAPHRLLER